MQEHVEVTGIVLKSEPIGDFDRRIVILSAERGKISAFAKGARRPNSRFVAGTTPFSFGTFALYEGKNSYTVKEIVVKNYFEDLRSDFDGAYYGMYFLEIADYYTRENNDEKDMLKLLYQSLRALISENFDNRLVRAIFELKAIMVNGEFPGIPIKEGREYLKSTVYAIDYINDNEASKVYSFTVKEDVLQELCEIAKKIRGNVINFQFKSLEIHDTLA